MIKRTLLFGNPCTLRKKDMQLLVEYPDETAEKRTVPIEDIGMLIMEDHQIHISNALLSALNDNNVVVISCNEKHLPNGFMLPMSAHNTFTERLYTQIEASLPLKKNLWQQTIVAKINNQAALLKAVGINISKMEAFSGKVRSGDPDNVEAHAAAYYWDNIFTHLETFTRKRFGESPNNLLNYAYAVLRAVVARSLVGSGLLPALGIHHHNKYNPWCLADDIMEPYRPYADIKVLEVIKQFEDIEELTPDIKRALLSIPVVDIIIGGESSPLMVGVQRTTASLAACFEGTTRRILYPELKL